MALSFTDADRAEIQKIIGKYPHKAAALLPVLHLAQERFGHLAPEVQTLVAHLLDVAPTRVREVVTFYEMYHEHAEGQFHLELCTNISCHLAGSDAVMDHLKQRLGIQIGHQTEDGMFSLMEAECLASCGSGPMMKVGLDYYEQLTPAACDALIDQFKKEAPGLSGRHYHCAKAGPHVGPVTGHAAKLLPIVPQSPPAPATPPAPAAPPAVAGAAPPTQAAGAPTPAPNPGPAPASAAPAAPPPPSPAAPVAAAASAPAAPLGAPPPIPTTASTPPTPSGPAAPASDGKASLPSFDPKVPKRE